MAGRPRGTSTARGKAAAPPRARRARPEPASAPPIDWIGAAAAKAKGKRPFFFRDPDVERVLNVAMALAMELSVARERIDTLERLLERKRVLKRAEIEAYVPDIDTGYERGAATRAYISRILRIVAQEREALADAKLDVDVEAVADELAKG